MKKFSIGKLILGNFYGEEIVAKLQTFSKDEMAAHILMQKIEPMAVDVIFF